MEKLKLEHLSPYLPYGLKCRISMIDNEGVIKYDHVNGVTNYQISQVEIDTNLQNTWVRTANGGKIGIPLIDIKPILRPLSDLKKWEEIDGEYTQYIHELSKLNNYTPYFDADLDFDFTDNMSSYFNFSDFEKVRSKLLEWHFDIFGLIDKGLAIDKNTI